MGSMIYVILFATFIGACSAGIATLHVVGDTKGWAPKVDYKTWSNETKEFYQGDILIFLYDEKIHDVLKVNKNDYDTCNAKAPLASFKTGKDQIPLDKPGDFFFICGVPGHCQEGMKVTVTVIPEAKPGQNYQDYN